MLVDCVGDFSGDTQSWNSLVIFQYHGPSVLANSVGLTLKSYEYMLEQITAIYY